MNGQPHFLSTKEAARRIGISKDALLDWLSKGYIPEPRRDWRGWRLWTEHDVEHAVQWNSRRYPIAPSPTRPGGLKRSGQMLLMIGLFVMSGVLFHPAKAAAGATLKVIPSAGIYEVGGLLDVSFLLDTGGEYINAVSADITFPADKLQVVNPAASTSFISIWVTAPSYSNSQGTITFRGGLPNPGIKTSGGVISTVTFRVKSPGKAEIKYQPTSKVLRNDGEGTNILTSTQPGEYTLKNPPPAGPVVSSPTHNDPNQWYNNPSVQFDWEPAVGAVGYSYSFDQEAKQIPDDSIDTIKTSTTATATADGVWYFHIKAKTEVWGGVTTYAVQIDLTPPANFEPKLDHNVVSVEEAATLRFLTTDAASGVDHYEVKQINKSGSQGIGNTLFVEATSPYTLPKLPEGDYEIVVRAFDRAGNSTERSTQLTIVAGGLPFFARVPFLRNPAVANVVLIGLVLLVVLSLGLLLRRRLHVRSAFQHDLKALEKDAQRKAEQLRRELDQIRQAEQLVQGNLAQPSPSRRSGQTLYEPPPDMPPVAEPPTLYQPGQLNQLNPPATPPTPPDNNSSTPSV